MLPDRINRQWDKEAGVARVNLPWPPASLSGHNTGHWSSKKDDIKALRLVAKTRTRKAKPTPPKQGDIRIHIRFYPPDNRGDRCNYPNRLKPLLDGIADALKVNDKRFLPSYEFCSIEKSGRVEVLVFS